jgi:hypothetical protein
MKSDPENRRQFFSRGARYLALGGMAVYVGGQVIKTERLQGDPECVRLHPCVACAELGGCGKPKAEAFRKGREI